MSTVTAYFGDSISVPQNALIAGNCNCAQLNSNNISPAVPNADLVVHPNGIQNFVIQTSATKCQNLECDSVTAQTLPNGSLSLAGNGSGNTVIGGTGLLAVDKLATNLNPSIQLNNSIIAETDGVQNLGQAGSGFGSLFVNTLNNGAAHDIAVAQALTVTGNVNPSSDGVYSLGANASVNWLALYSEQLANADGGHIQLNNTLLPLSGLVNLGGSGNQYGATWSTQVDSNQYIILGKNSFNQATNITTTVAITGSPAPSAFQIVTQTATTASTATTTFAVTASAVSSNSYVICNMVSYSGTPFTNGVPFFTISGVAAGTFNCNIINYGANALSGTFTLQFVVV